MRSALKVSRGQACAGRRSSPSTELGAGGRCSLRRLLDWTEVGSWCKSFCTPRLGVLVTLVPRAPLEHLQAHEVKAGQLGRVRGHSSPYLPVTPVTEGSRHSNPLHRSSHAAANAVCLILIIILITIVIRSSGYLLVEDITYVPWGAWGGD